MDAKRLPEGDPRPGGTAARGQGPAAGGDLDMTEETGFMHQAKTPRAAAIAGIVFAVLFSSCVVLIRLAAPADITDLDAWTDTARRMVSISLALISLAGVAFLWFIGVVRHRLGAYEDQFFATVVQGSGLLFLAMTFSAFALAAGVFATLPAAGQQVSTPEVYVVVRAIMSQMFNMYAIKMAAVFMISLSTLWLRTGVMPRWLSYISYALALLMLFSLSFSVWMELWFPAWVLAVSIHFLISSYRRTPSGDGDGAPAQPATS